MIVGTGTALPHPQQASLCHVLRGDLLQAVPGVIFRHDNLCRDAFQAQAGFIFPLIRSKPGIDRQIDPVLLQHLLHRLDALQRHQLHPQLGRFPGKPLQQRRQNPLIGQAAETADAQSFLFVPDEVPHLVITAFHLPHERAEGVVNLCPHLGQR